MRDLLYLWAMLFAISSCSIQEKSLSLDDIFEKHFEHKMISSGNNFPDFYVKKDSLDLFLVSLHEQIHVKKFQKKVNWNDEVFEKYVAFLESKNWIVRDDILKPTIFIATDTQGQSLFSYSIPIAIDIVDSIEEELHNIQKLYNTTNLSKTHNFGDLTFFILSDVLLDNWQINNVENEFLNAEKRPERHQNNYYYAIMENVLYPKEEFGIYGNQYNNVNDSIILSIYGNNRNVASYKLKQDKMFLDSILNSAPKISHSDFKKFDSIANYFKPKLIKILARNRNYINNVYEKTGYAKEISFEEFFIWWYHFIYTEVTNMLAEKGIVKIPAEGNFYYITKGEY